jgi:hypothetical protein
MKVEIDLDAVLAQAVQHMEEPNDLRWSIGAALQDLYWDAWVRDLQTKMSTAYKEAQQAMD